MSSLLASIVPTTLPALIEWFHAQRIREVIHSTVHRETLYLIRFFEYLPPLGSPADLFDVLCPKLITEFLLHYAAHHGPGSRRWMHNTLRLFLRALYYSGFLATDLSAFCVQIRRLCLEDIRWEKDQIHFCAAKGGRPIEQFLTVEAGNSLVKYITEARPPSSCKEVFITLKAPFRPLTHSYQLSRMIRKRIRQAGIELPAGVSYGSHGFRHAFVSALYGRVPFKDIVDMLGHRSPSSTLIYGKIDLPMLRKAALAWPGGRP